MQILRQVVSSGGMVWGDATTAFDISQHWQGCRNVYTAPGRFQLIVEHELSRVNPDRGIMTRRLMTPADTDPVAWVETAVERDEVLGLPPAVLHTALQRYFGSVSIFDWETGGSDTEQSRKVGYIAVA